MLSLEYSIASAQGLRGNDRDITRRLVKAWRDHYERNMLRHFYYTMENTLVDLGISIPPSCKDLNAACGWGKKTVNTMAKRSLFDGYAVDDENIAAMLKSVVKRNRFKTIYRKATISALEQSFNLYFVTSDDDNHAIVRPYPANSCGVTWDYVNNELEAALFVVDIKKNNTGIYEPTWVNVVTDTDVIRIRKDGGIWRAEYVPHGLEHLPVFLASHESTLDRPFGSSRITREVMGYIDSAVRANINEEIAAAFAASTQKYLLGTDGDAFSQASRWQAYIGSIFNIDMTEDGTIPQFGQLPQPSMEPMTAHFRNLCAKMSAATGIHVSQFGIVHDQPASAEAIYAENEPLIQDVKSWNTETGYTLTDVAIACIATEEETTFDEIEQRDYNILPRFADPTLPTQAQAADSVIKIASVEPTFPKTRTFWYRLGYNEEQTNTVLDELRQAEQGAAEAAALAAIFGGGVNADTA